MKARPPVVQEKVYFLFRLILEMGGLLGATVLVGGATFYTVVATLLQDPWMRSPLENSIQILSIGAMFIGVIILLFADLALIVLSNLPKTSD